jgi:hypothetical protein
MGAGLLTGSCGFARGGVNAGFAVTLLTGRGASFAACCVLVPASRDSAFGDSVSGELVFWWGLLIAANCFLSVSISAC